MDKATTFHPTHTGPEPPTLSVAYIHPSIKQLTGYTDATLIYGESPAFIGLENHGHQREKPWPEYSQGEQVAYSKIVARHRELIRRIVKAIVFQHHDWEEVEQIVLIMIYRGFKNFYQHYLSHACPEALVGTFTKYIIFNYIKRLKRVKERLYFTETFPKIEDEILEGVIAEEQVQGLYKAMEILPHRPRQVINMVLQGYTYQQIALHTGTQVKSVSGSVQGALRIIRENFRQFFSDMSIGQEKKNLRSTDQLREESRAFFRSLRENALSFREVTPEIRKKVESLLASKKVATIARELNLSYHLVYYIKTTHDQPGYTRGNRCPFNNEQIEKSIHLLRTAPMTLKEISTKTGVSVSYLAKLKRENALVAVKRPGGLGNRLKDGERELILARLAAGETKVALAKYFGVSTMTIHNVATGKYGKCKTGRAV